MFLYTLRSGLNPARFPYLRRTTTQTLGIDRKGIGVLDVGCAEVACSRRSSRSLDARRQASIRRASSSRGQITRQQIGLDIDYVEGTGEALPFPDAAFEVVYCCDVLEHVDESARRSPRSHAC